MADQDTIQSPENCPAAETVRQAPESYADELKALKLWRAINENESKESKRRERNNESMFPTFHNFCSADFLMFHMRDLYLWSKMTIMAIRLARQGKEIDFTKLSEVYWFDALMASGI
jgi:hypothetical protein